MITKQPQVILFSHTKEPLKAVALAVSAWSSDNFFESLDEIPIQTAIENTQKAQKAFHRTALEYVDTIWVIKNCSRAFQQQITRTRHASFSIQSMRVILKKGFATNGHYTMPPGISEIEKIEFHKKMLTIERMYSDLIDSGVSAEDARGILPLNIHSDISMRINMNAMYHMLEQRLCVNTQWEYRQVATQMKLQVELKLGKFFSSRINAPCLNGNKCPMRNEYCGIPVWNKKYHEQIYIYKNFVRHKNTESGKIITWLDSNEENVGE